MSRFAGTKSPSPERPPEDTAIVASTLDRLFRRGDVSTMLPTLPRSFLSRYLALYRPLMAGLWATDAAICHACGQGRERGVERARVVAMESRG